MNPIVFWNDWNRGKIAAHGVTEAEVLEVLEDPNAVEETSRSSGLPLVKGFTLAGRFLVVVYKELDAHPLRIFPITAYEPD